MLIHIIADFGAGDLAFAEVSQQVQRHLPEARPILTSVPPFATLSAGFCVAQLGLNPAPEGTVIFHNVAPRHDDKGARRDNGGEPLVYARLPGGIQVVGVNAGYAFSYLREVADQLRVVNVPLGGSQFRSRDLFPSAVARVVREQPEALAGPLDPGEIPVLPEGRIAYIDGFGNMKTTFRAGSLSYAGGQELDVRIGDSVQRLRFSDSSFGVPHGTLALSTGSSGWRLGGANIRWLELFLRGGSAWQRFGGPSVGDIVEVTAAGSAEIRI